MSVFFLTKTQEKVFLALQEEGESTSSLALRTKLPRTSVGKALHALAVLGLVKGRKVRDKNRHLYCKVSAEEIIAKVDAVKNTLIGKEFHGRMSFVHSAAGSIAVHTGKEAILTAIHAIVSLYAGERVYVLQGTGVPEAWNRVIGIKEAMKINDTFNKNGLIWVSLRSKSFIAEFKKKALETHYRGRIGDVHVLPDECFEDNVATYVFKRSVLVVDLENVVALEINDKKIAAMFKKIFRFLLDKTPKEHVS